MANVLVGNTTFSVESSYIDLQCEKQSQWSNEVRNQPDNLNLTSSSGWLSEPEPRFADQPSNGTYQGDYYMENQPATWHLGLDTFVDSYWYDSGVRKQRNGTDGIERWAYPAFLINETGIETSMGSLYFKSADVTDFQAQSPIMNFTTTYCLTQQVYVESRINCTSVSPSLRTCSVVAQRPSQSGHVSSNITLLSWADNFRWVSQMPLATNQDGLGGISDASLYFIVDPTVAYMTRTRGYADVFNVQPEVFSRRLSQLINSYLLLAQAYTSTANYTGNLPGQSKSASQLQTALVEVYTISKAWLTIFFLAVLTMLGSAMTGIVLHRTAIIPDIVGACSSMVRDSRYVQLNMSSSRVDGTNLALEIGKDRFQFGVVDEGDASGKILGIGRTEDVLRVRNKEKYV